MSISVQNLTKTYGSQKAVDHISFTVRPGEILGFLGPNGAGKSTTMKMITGFLRQDDGTIDVNGFNPVDQPLEVKKQIGYLPEHNPLYLDFYVREYLHFMAQIHHVSGAKQRIEEVIQTTGLGLEAHKKIGALSKGYRQRVGLAQALLHDPAILILDEPTSGLDPNQLAEIRNLIRTLGKSKTLIFSTHIMQEVQAVCDRVIILNRGRIVIDRPIGYLSEIGKGGQVVIVQFDRRILTPSLASLPGVSSVDEMENGMYRVHGKKDSDIRPVIFKFAVEKTAGILEMYTEKSTVEDVFRQFTTKTEA